MEQALSEIDLRRTLDVIAAAAESPARGEPLSPDVLRALAAVIPCDVIAVTEFDPYQRVVYHDEECTGTEVRIVPAAYDDAASPFYDHYWTTKSCSYAMRTGDVRSVITRSDFYSRREWLQTPMYRDCFADSGLVDELICCLPSPPNRARRLIFFRSGAQEFDDHDRFVLSLLRPHLAEVRARVDEPSLLTPRQYELLHLVAAGWTNDQIAAHLVLSTHTVRKHLENIFARLGVSNRAAAVARAFPPAGVATS